MCNTYQHAVDILNGIYVDENQKVHDIVDFLQIQLKSSDPIYTFSERFEKQRLRAEDIGFESNDIITRKTFMDGSLTNIRRGKWGLGEFSALSDRISLYRTLATLRARLKEKY
jgi:hypothetical protein